MGANEDEAERLDRELDELLNEMRVSLSAVTTTVTAIVYGRPAALGVDGVAITLCALMWFALGSLRVSRGPQ